MAVAAAGVYVAFRLLNADVKALNQKFKEVNPSVAMGDVSRELRSFFKDMQRGAKLGNDVNAYMDAAQRVEFAVTDLVDEFRKPIMEAVVPILQQLAEGLEFIKPGVALTADVCAKIFATISLSWNFLGLTEGQRKGREQAIARLLGTIAKNTAPKADDLQPLLQMLKMDALNPNQRQPWQRPPAEAPGDGAGMMFGS